MQALPGTPSLHQSSPGQHLHINSRRVLHHPLHDSTDIPGLQGTEPVPSLHTLAQHLRYDQALHLHIVGQQPPCRLPGLCTQCAHGCHWRLVLSQGCRGQKGSGYWGSSEATANQDLGTGWARERLGWAQAAGLGLTMKALPSLLHSQHTHTPHPTTCYELAVHLHQKLFISEGQNVGDGGRLIVQAEAGEEQEQGRWRGTPLLPGAVTEALSRLAHGPDETHNEALTDTLAAELTL